MSVYFTALLCLLYFHFTADRKQIEAIVLPFIAAKGQFEKPFSLNILEHSIGH